MASLKGGKGKRKACVRCGGGGSIREGGRCAKCDEQEKAAGATGGMSRAGHRDTQDQRLSGATAVSPKSSKEDDVDVSDLDEDLIKRIAAKVESRLAEKYATGAIKKKVASSREKSKSLDENNEDLILRIMERVERERAEQNAVTGAGKKTAAGNVARSAPQSSRETNQMSVTQPVSEEPDSARDGVPVGGARRKVPLAPPVQTRTTVPNETTAAGNGDEGASSTASKKKKKKKKKTGTVEGNETVSASVGASMSARCDTQAPRPVESTQTAVVAEEGAVSGAASKKKKKKKKKANAEVPVEPQTVPSARMEELRVPELSTQTEAVAGDSTAKKKKKKKKKTAAVADGNEGARNENAGTRNGNAQTGVRNEAGTQTVTQMVNESVEGAVGGTQNSASKNKKKKKKKSSGDNTETSTTQQTEPSVSQGNEQGAVGGTKKKKNKKKKKNEGQEAREVTSTQGNNQSTETGPSNSGRDNGTTSMRDNTTSMINLTPSVRDLLGMYISQQTVNQRSKDNKDGMTQQLTDLMQQMETLRTEIDEFGVRIDNMDQVVKRKQELAEEETKPVERVGTRSKNLMLFNLPEPDLGIKKLKEHDLKACQEIISTELKIDTTVRWAVRIGKKKLPNPGEIVKPRPVLMKLYEADKVVLAEMYSRRLRKAVNPLYRSVFIDYDIPPKAKKEQKEIVDGRRNRLSSNA